MNAITRPAPPAPHPAPHPAPDLVIDEAPQEHTLRRSGRKPVRFTGWQLVEASGTAAGQLRYDLNLYRTVGGSIVVELVAQRRALGEPDLLRVKTFEDFAQAAAWLEAHRCAEDVPVPPGLASADTPLAWAVLQAVQLRQRLERIEADYQALLGEVFLALDLAEPAEPG